MSWDVPDSADDPVFEHVGSWTFHRGAKKASPAVIREVLARPVDRSNPNTAVLAALVDPELPDDELVDSWKRALRLFADLDTTYAWGSKKRRAKITGVAADPEAVAAIQGAVAGCENASLDQLAVLAVDGSEASQDAVFKHFDAALRSQDHALDWIARLRTYAPEGSAFSPLLDRVEAQLQARNDASPALDLAERLGLGTPTTFHFSVFLMCEMPSQYDTPTAQAHLEVDSRSVTWFRAYVHTPHGPVGFGGDHQVDDAGLGSCTPDELPDWLARAAKTLDITWNWDGMSLRSSLRGKKREWLRHWLRGQSTAPFR